jgi:hypothetical protein
MKTYYFYTLHGQFGTSSELNHSDIVLESIERKDGILLRAANQYFNSISKIREQFELDNGIDVRYFKVYGFKEVTKKSYDWIVEDDKRIISRMSEKSKQLLIKFGFNTDSWHRPFKINFGTENNIKRYLELRANKIPYIDSEDLTIELLDE